MSERILIVDDEPMIRWALRERLQADGYDCLEADNGESAAVLIDEGEFDLALLDLRIPKGDGMTLLRQMKKTMPDTPAIIITAYSSVDNAVAAMRDGAYDYITKPFNMDAVAIAVVRALEAGSLRRQLNSRTTELRRKYGFACVVGDSTAMREIRALAQRLAGHESATVLLLGESGSGKDLLARAIHYESSRAYKPFMNITCTALAESLLESELFGYEKGAFTGATARKQGLFEAADGGTVFLDEIGELTPGLQAKLLRVIEEKAFHRVGGTQDVMVNVRIVAATNKDLQSEMKAGRFRPDLFYRLTSMPILLPPLRLRTSDISLLARHFLAEMSREAHRVLDGFTPAAEKALTGYAWPGNVRELRNVIERAVLLADGPMVDESGLALGRFAINKPQAGSAYMFQLPPGGCDLAKVEEELVRQALDQCGGNQTQAAELLNITRDQVRYRLGKYGALTE